MNQKPQHAVFRQAFSDQLGFQPTADQAVAIQQLTDFVLNRDSLDIFILSGYAGTGKTSLIGALVNTMRLVKTHTVLLAPTGRAAKVLSGYSGQKAATIHRHIYYPGDSDDSAGFSLVTNRFKDTLFIVDEASMIGIDSGVGGESHFTPRNLLNDLIEYVYSAENCKLIFVGDRGQLPPVGMAISPALDANYLKQEYALQVIESPLNQIVRQKKMSGILELATALRDFSEEIPLLPHNKTDARALSGLDLQDELEACISKYGRDEVMVVTRSNKRANLFNEQIRRRVLWQEEDLNAGDVLMATKNNYFWIEPKSEAGFIANGELMEIKKIVRREELYGFEFADVIVRLIDYPDMEDVELKIILNSIRVDGPSLPRDQLKLLFQNIVQEDYPYEMNKRVRNRKLMAHPHFQALQVKFGYAVTCHKAQGGQWEAVFVDHGYFTDEMWNTEYMRWLYTAITRARTQLYLVNFSPAFVGEES
ncbi:MAG: AAA family ATPase [Bacteroidetes bacterium]|nr:AAA family ATPase [Bacteroidota bacterium]